MSDFLEKIDEWMEELPIRRVYALVIIYGMVAIILVYAIITNFKYYGN